MADKPETESEGGEADRKAARGWFASRRARPSVGEAVSAKPAPPPPPSKTRKTGLIGIFSGLMTVGAIIAVLVIGFVSVSQKQFTAPGPLAADRTVIIEKGSTSEDIVETLQREGVITSSSAFWAALIWRDIQSKMSSDQAASKRAKAGEYLFKQRVTMNEVLEIITSGRSVQHTITIPEGLTSEQIVERLRENDLLAGEITTIPIEGALLPDTYRIDRGTPRTQLLARMEREQKRVLAEVWQRRAKDLPLKSPRELVTMASIVEKETGRADERPRVAGVFVNRLEKKMRLQSDPTIIYGLVGGKGALGRGLTRSEIDRPTPYNTYTINGLPPGPIANPGRAALEATANPSKVKDLYFVADGTGGHVFAETLEQHNRNVARWRQIEGQRRDAPAAPAPVPTAPSLETLQAPLGDRSAVPQSGAAGQGVALGFSAPTRRNDATANAPAPPPTREAVGTVPARAPVAPRAAQPRPGAVADPLGQRDYDLSTPKTVPNLN